MYRFVVGLATCLAVGWSGLVPGARGDDSAKQAKADPAQELAAIEKDWTDTQQTFYKAFGEAKTKEERDKVLKNQRPNPAAFGNRALKLAETYPTSPVAVEALGWVVSNARGTPAAGKALPLLKDKVAAITDLDRLHTSLMKLSGFGLAEIAPVVAEKARKHLDHPQALPLLMWVGAATLYGGTAESSKLYNDTVDLLVDRFVERQELAPLPNWLRQDDDPAWAEKHLRRLMAKNPSALIKTQSRFALASVLKSKDEASQPEAEKLFRGILDETAKLSSPSPDEKQLVDEVRKELEDMKLRGLGKPAPQISGLDLDGKTFKLSDYKGKVVLLDFWGNW
jgi:hypothetical protein